MYLDEGLGHHTGSGLGPLPCDHAQDLARAEGLQLVVDGGARVLVDVGVVVPEYDVKKISSVNVHLDMKVMFDNVRNGVWRVQLDNYQGRTSYQSIIKRGSHVLSTSADILQPTCYCGGLKEYLHCWPGMRRRARRGRW